LRRSLAELRKLQTERNIRRQLPGSPPTASPIPGRCSTLCTCTTNSASTPAKPTASTPWKL
jgi:hypothetical protein